MRERFLLNQMLGFKAPGEAGGQYGIFNEIIIQKKLQGGKKSESDLISSWITVMTILL